jgi:hypothetical protein
MIFDKVNKIEIEVFSKCNRRCNWCPNVSLNRLTENFHMDEETYLRLLKNLKDNGFKGQISFSRYNEPTANHKLLQKRVKQAKEILPDNYMLCNTNGDYLRRKGDEILDGLMLDEINIMDYDCRGIEHGKELFKKCNIKEKSKQGFTGHQQVKYRTGHKLIGEYKNIKIVHYYADWPKHHKIETRGGFFIDAKTGKPKKVISNYGNKGVEVPFKKDAKRRKHRCNKPTINMNIDFNGVVNPCCHIRSDNPEHEKYGLGNINDISVQEIYTSKKARKFRKLLMSDDWKNYPDPCKYCTKG